jgi:hypothetical protein
MFPASPPCTSAAHVILRRGGVGTGLLRGTPAGNRGARPPPPVAVAEFLGLDLLDLGLDLFDLGLDLGLDLVGLDLLGFNLVRLDLLLDLEGLALLLLGLDLLGLDLLGLGLLGLVLTTPLA